MDQSRYIIRVFNILSVVVTVDLSSPTAAECSYFPY